MTEMNNNIRCETCGAPLHAIDDLCSNCLIKAGMDDTATVPIDNIPPKKYQTDLNPAGGGWDYELLNEIAQGGMGVVYKARQKKLNRLVALKMLLAGGFARPEVIKRFVAEAEVVAQLDHPHIVPIYEIGRHDGQTYFSMKLIEGGTLKEALPELIQDFRRGVELMVKVTNAVHFAHQRGVLHRDLKPGNILLDEEGVPWVTDFGLAKQVGQNQDLTQTGAIMGTPAYMAPEQARVGGAPLTVASDVYSLGAILYHLFTGRPPFVSEDPLETLQLTQTEEPVNPIHLNQELPIDLSTICLKCLEKNPSLRYHSAESLSQDLERWLQFRPIEARPSGFWERKIKWAQRKPTIAILSALLVLFSVFGVGGLIWQVNQKQAALEEARQATLDLATARAPSVKARKTIRHGDWAASVVFSRDGSKLLTSSHDKTARISDAFTGETLVEFNGSQGVLSWAEFNHDETLVLTVSIDEGFFYPYLAPTGESLILSQGPWYGESVVRVWDANTGAQKCELKKHTAQVTDACFSSDGQWIASCSLDGTAVVWNATSGELVHTLEGHEASINSVKFTPDSRLLATTSMGALMKHTLVVRDDGSSSMSGTTQSAFETDLVRFWNVETGDYQGGLKNRFKSGLFGAQSVKDSRCDVTFSDDGRFAVTSGGVPENTGLWDLHTFEWLGGLDGHAHAVLESVFSPEGHSVVTACADHTARIFQVPSCELIQEFKGHDAPVLGVDFSADGSKLLTSSADGIARIWDVETGYGLALLEGHTDRVVDVKFHPDNFHIATASRDHTVKLWESGTLEQMAITFKGHTQRVDRLDFHPSSRYIASASSDRSARIWSLDQPEISVVLKGYPTVKSNTARDRLLGDVTAVCFTPDGNGLWTGASDLEGGYQASLFHFKMGGVQNLKFEPAKLWDWQEGKVDWGVPGLPGGIDNVVAGPNQQYVLVLPDGRYQSGIIDGRGTAQQGSHQQYQVARDPFLYDANSRKLVGILNGFPQQIDHVVFSPDSRLLAVSDKLDEVRIYQTEDGQLLQKMARARAGDHMFFQDGGKRFFAGRHLLEPALWDVESGEQVLKFEGLDSMMVGAWPSVDASEILIFTLEGSLHAFDASTGKLTYSWNTRENLSPHEFRMVRLSPDRKLLAIRQQGNLQTIEIWNVKDRSLVSAIRAHHRQINDMKFSPDSQWLATASNDYTVKAWPVGLFVQPSKPTGHDESRQ
jgi:WD40 repeat protein/tRNA A-37 threonylcarbamoyl transferase component Bud32